MEAISCKTTPNIPQPYIKGRNDFLFIPTMPMPDWAQRSINQAPMTSLWHSKPEEANSVRNPAPVQNRNPWIDGPNYLEQTTVEEYHRPNQNISKGPNMLKSPVPKVQGGGFVQQVTDLLYPKTDEEKKGIKKGTNVGYGPNGGVAYGYVDQSKFVLKKPQVYYISPMGYGTAEGSTPLDAAYYLDHDSTTYAEQGVPEADGIYIDNSLHYLPIDHTRTAEQGVPEAPEGAQGPTTTNHYLYRDTTTLQTQQNPLSPIASYNNGTPIAKNAHITRNVPLPEQYRNAEVSTGIIYNQQQGFEYLKEKLSANQLAEVATTTITPVGKSSAPSGNILLKNKAGSNTVVTPAPVTTSIIGAILTPLSNLFLSNRAVTNVVAQAPMATTTVTRNAPEQKEGKDVSNKLVYNAKGTLSTSVRLAGKEGLQNKHSKRAPRTEGYTPGGSAPAPAEQGQSTRKNRRVNVENMQIQSQTIPTLPNYNDNQGRRRKSESYCMANYTAHTAPQVPS